MIYLEKKYILKESSRQKDSDLKLRSEMEPDAIKDSGLLVCHIMLETRWWYTVVILVSCFFAEYLIEIGS